MPVLHPALRGLYISLAYTLPYPQSSRLYSPNQYIYISLDECANRIVAPLETANGSGECGHILDSA
jgi:hypothetical protein